MGNKQKEIKGNNTNDLKIVLYPKKKPRYKLEKSSLILVLPSDVIEHSFEINKELAYIESNVP